MLRQTRKVELIKNSKYLLPPRSLEFDQRAVQAGLDPLLAGIVYNRGITDIADIKKILETSESPSFHDPFLFKDMQIAAELIMDAAINQKRIIVYGDYDVDGIAATAIMVATLEELGACVEYAIPNRFDEGYGLNLEFIESVGLDADSLLITVDCGIASVGEVLAAKNMGAKIIITDHHLPGEVLPAADAILNPQLPDSGYPEKKLCGASVAWKLAHALLEECPYEYIDLAALATVADVVPLLGENRQIVSAGLNIIRQGRRLALNKIMEASSVSYKDADTQKIAFSIAPRINSLGRMGDASPAVQMLLSDNEDLVSKLVAQCVNDNKTRQQIEKKILEEAICMVESQGYDLAGAIVVGSEGWHQGVLGIVASRLVETYGVPAIVLNYDDGVAKGSARSIAGYNIRRALDACAAYLIRYGGHAMAAGLEVDVTQITAFRTFFAEHAKKYIDANAVSLIHVDASLGLDYVAKDFINKLQLLEPTGTGFPRPLFHFSGLKAVGIRKIGAKGEHILFNLEDGRKTVQGIHFRYNGPEIMEGQDIEVVGIPEINEYNGYSSARIFVEDILLPVNQVTGSISLKIEKNSETMIDSFCLGCDFLLSSNGEEMKLRNMRTKDSFQILFSDNPALVQYFDASVSEKKLRLCWVNWSEKKLLFISNPEGCIFSCGRGFSKPIIYKGIDIQPAVKLINSSGRNSVIIGRDEAELLADYEQLKAADVKIPILVMLDGEKSRSTAKFMTALASGRQYILLVTKEMFEMNLINPVWLASGVQFFYALFAEVDSLEEKIYYSTSIIYEQEGF